MKISSLTIGQRVALGFALLLLLASGLGGFAAWNMLTASRGAHFLEDAVVPQSEIAATMKKDVAYVMLQMRAYGYTGDPEQLAKSRKYLADLGADMATARTLIQAQPSLTDLRDALPLAEKTLDAFTARVNDTAANQEALAELRSQLEVSGNSFILDITAFINDQDRKLAAEIAGGLPADKLQERRTKLSLSNEIIDAGNAIRVATYKAQALRQPELMDKVLPLFGTIEATRAKLQGLTSDEGNLKQLASVAQTAASYKAGMEGIVKNFADSIATNTARIAAANELDALIQGIVDRSSEKTRTYAETTSDGLEQTSSLVIGGLIAMAVIGLVVAVLIIRGVNKALTAMAQSLTQGSLQVAAASARSPPPARRSPKAPANRPHPLKKSVPRSKSSRA